MNICLKGNCVVKAFVGPRNRYVRKPEFCNLIGAFTFLRATIQKIAPMLAFPGCADSAVI